MTANRLALVVSKVISPESTVTREYNLLSEKVTCASLRYVATRNPDGSGVYLRGNTKEFSDAIALRKPLLSLEGVTAVIEYEYHVAGDKPIDIPFVSIPLSSILSGFEVSRKLATIKASMDAVSSSWIDGRNPPLAIKVSTPKEDAPESIPDDTLAKQVADDLALFTA